MAAPFDEAQAVSGDDLVAAACHAVFEKEAQIRRVVTSAVRGANRLMSPGQRGAQAARSLTRTAPKAVTHAAPVAPAAGAGFKHGWNEFKAGLTSGKRFGIGSEEAATAAPSLWRSVGHGVADQAVGGAVSGAVLGGAMGAYNAPKGEGMSGALTGATQGAKAGFVSGIAAGAAGGALRHGRYNALRAQGLSHNMAHGTMSKSVFDNVKDAWANRGTPGAWHADALEAAAVPATLVVENVAQGIGEMKQDKRADAPDLVADAVRQARIVKIARAAAGPQVIVVPMMGGSDATPEERAALRAERDQYETDKAVGKAVAPLVGAAGAESLLRATLDPAVRAAQPGSMLAALQPDSVPRKILLPGLGAALGAYGAHRLIQARRENREGRDVPAPAPAVAT